MILRKGIKINAIAKPIKNGVNILTTLLRKENTGDPFMNKKQKVAIKIPAIVYTFMFSLA